MRNRAYLNLPYGLAAFMLLVAMALAGRGIYLRTADFSEASRPPLERAAIKAGSQLAGSLFFYWAAGAFFQSALFACFGAIIAELRVQRLPPATAADPPVTPAMNGLGAIRRIVSEEAASAGLPATVPRLALGKNEISLDLAVGHFRSRDVVRFTYDLPDDSAIPFPEILRPKIQRAFRDLKLQQLDVPRPPAPR